MASRFTPTRLRAWASRRWMRRLGRRAERFEATERNNRPSGRYAELYFAHEGRHVHKWWHYFPIYDRVFGPLAGQPIRFLEIGVQHGGSLELWREYLGPAATIFGVDIDARCAAVGGPTTPVRIGSQADPGFLRSVVEEMGGIDVVLDDGSHVAKHQRASFDTLFPLLNDGGLYVIEDAHTSYWFAWGGGLRRPGTAIQMAKGLVDGMHRWYFRAPLEARSRPAQTEVTSVCFYSSIVVIEKGRRDQPIAGRTGTPSF